MNRRMTVKGKERRRDRRRHLNLSGRIQGQDVFVVDISITGFGAVADATNAAQLHLPEGHHTRLEISLDDGRRLEMDVEIKRAVTKDGLFGGRFISLPDKYFRIIEGLMLGREHRS